MAAIVGGGQLSPQGLSIAQIIATLIGLLVALAYYCILEMTTGMTLGKLIMGTKDFRSDGTTASQRLVSSRRVRRVDCLMCMVCIE